MGPQHPSTHGVLHLIIKTDGEIIKHVDPDIGFLHRNFEKHCEFSSYPQIIPYVDRLDYLAAMNCEHVYVCTVEKLLDLELPERVEYIRVIMAELNRIASHLVAIGTYGLDVGTFTPFLWCFRDREYILDLFELNCGARLLYNYIWVGGVSHDLHPR
ncbi:MAG: NADH-quinone oxidoreductase subunit D, partial [Deltaproteobacteria bacterium]